VHVCAGFCLTHTYHSFTSLTPQQSHELDRLNQLRQAYIQRITRRMKSKSVDEDHISPGRREISFLERNLEELTRAHKRVRHTAVCYDIAVK